MRIKVNSSELKELVNSLDRYDERCRTAFSLYGKTKALDLENKAKKTAKWTDRTGQARRSIEGDFKEYKDRFSLELSGYAKNEYKKEYFQYLENGKLKKYSILEPTIKENADEVVEGFVKVLSKVEL